MENLNVKYFKTIGEISNIISKEKNIDSALKSGLKLIVKQTDIDCAVLWYHNEADGKLPPYYWICPTDITSLSYNADEGIIGKVYTENSASVILDFKASPDERISSDFGGLDIASVVCTPFSNDMTGLGCVEFLKLGEPLDEDSAEICQLLTMLTEMAIKEYVPANEWKEREVIMSVRDLKKDFQNGDILTKVLKGINFDIFDGEFICFLGESGCGKSTLLNIIGGLDKATSGRFSFMGKDYSGAEENELTDYRRDNIGFVFQSYNLMPNLTAKQNIDLIAELVEKPMDSHEALKLVKMEDRADNYPSQLSGGQQQRVSIARALVKKPKLIMADEPTAALDYQTSIEILSTFEDVIASGTTLIMVTHNEEITRMANRVIRFRDGKVYEITVNNKPAKAVDLVW